MEIITSPANKTVKLLNKLKSKKYREQFGAFFIEGYKNVLDSWTARPDSVKVLVFAQSFYEVAEKSFRNAECEVAVLADELFSRVSETESSQGVLSINALPGYVFPAGERCVLLDRVRDPGNVGTILRTACACGYDVVANNSADIFSPKVTRSSMSAILKCNIGTDIPPEELKAAGYELIAADMFGEDIFCAAKPAGKYCIIIGNEADGVSAELKKLCDRAVSIPQENMESLNAAVAAAIMMYGLRYQNN